jgi:hypothetical protein
MVLALDRAGVDVRLMSFPRKDSPSNITTDGEKIRRKPFQMAQVGICYGFPNAFTSLMNRVKIGFTMFETDTLPRTRVGNEWAGETGQPEVNCNKMDTLFVPSSHNRELFRKEGVTVPIEVVPLGVDPAHYIKMDRPKRDTFTFLMYGVLTIRKNPGAVLSAFLELFKDNPKVKMVFKTHSGTMGAIQMPYKNVEIIDEYSTPEKMMEYMREADCFVFPSRGEGFGLTPLEAMSTGLPAIVADNTGMSDYCDPDYTYPVPCPVKSKAIRFPPKWGNVGNWYEPDYKVLKETMAYVYQNREEAYKKGLRAADWVRGNWTFDNTAKIIINKIENVLDSR